MDSETKWIFRVAVITLSSVVAVIIVALLIGLFIPSIENDKIFAIIGPSFQTIIGCFVGLLGGLSLTKKGE